MGVTHFVFPSVLYAMPMKRLLLLLIFLTPLAHALRLTGTLTDPEFQKGDSLQLELVEKGTLLPIRQGESFSLELPTDTLWNLCVRSDSLEKCYELLYLGSDSTFSASLGGEERITWYEDGSVEKVELSPVDSSAGLDVDSLLKA